MNATHTDDGLFCFLGPHWKCQTIVVLKQVSASVSLLGCLFVFLLIWLFRKYRTVPQRLVCHMIAGAFISSMSYLLDKGFNYDGALCSFQGFLMTFGEWSVLLWVCCITFNIFTSALFERQLLGVEWAYVGIAWGASLLISVLPLTVNAYGPAGPWCWIRPTNFSDPTDYNYTAWRFGIWYVPLFVLVITMLVAYVSIILFVRRRIATWQGAYDPDADRRRQILREDIKPLWGYPLVYLTLATFSFVNRLQNALDKFHPMLALYCLMAISSPLKGALNALVFTLDRDTYQRLNRDGIRMAWLERSQRAVQIRDYPAVSVPASVPSSDDRRPVDYGSTGAPDGGGGGESQMEHPGQFGTDGTSPDTTISTLPGFFQSTNALITSQTTASIGGASDLNVMLSGSPPSLPPVESALPPDGPPRRQVSFNLLGDFDPSID